MTERRRIDQILKFSIVLISAGKNNMVFDETDFGFWRNSKTNKRRYMTFYWLFKFAFFIHDKIFKIFGFILNFLGTFSVSNFISFFFL